MINTKCTTANLGDFENSVRETLDNFQRENLSERLWARDPSLWKSDPSIQEKIKNRLGWLSLTQTMPKMIEALETFAISIKDAGFKDVFLLGMGGSSLCPEVLKQTFASAPGYPRLTVLDTTDPEAILSAEVRCDLKKTLFILASKSGSTIEMWSLYRYFSEKVRAVSGNDMGNQFIAITDPGSPLEKLAGEKNFRKTFSTPADVGGRYSALTAFGLVPAALLGINLSAFLNSAEAMTEACAASVAPESNPGLLLGAIMGALGGAGRDKLTLVPSTSLCHFGIWAEQLVAESTGKEGKGLVPIDGETLGDPAVYGNDRLFIYLRLASDDCTALDQKTSKLQEAGYPLVRIDLKDCSDLAGEFLRWEIATAVSGMLLAVNPFDEPNVSESKANTADVLERYEKTGALDLPPAVSVAEGLSVAGDLKEAASESLEKILSAFLGQARDNQYIGLMAYFCASEAHDHLLQQLRTAIRDKHRLATTLGYGPRFLHSTGQLHKGGGRRGLFIQFTADDAEDLPIPDTPYSFGVLKRAQALGDFHSLVRHRLIVLEIRLGKDIKAGLDQVIQAI